MSSNCFLDHYWGCVIQLVANNNYFSLVTTNNPRSLCKSKPGPVFLSFLNWQVPPPQLPSSLAHKNSLLSFKINIYLVGLLLRLVFTSNRVGVGVGVVIRSVFWFFWFHLQHAWLRPLRSSENWVVGVTSRSGRTKPITKPGNVHCDWFILPLLLPTLTIWFSLDHKRNVSGEVGSKVGRKQKCSNSSDSDFIRLMTAYDSDFWFSLGDKYSYNSTYDSNSNSVTSENQPLSDIRGLTQPIKWWQWKCYWYHFDVIKDFDMIHVHGFQPTQLSVKFFSSCIVTCCHFCVFIISSSEPCIMKFHIADM